MTVLDDIVAGAREDAADRQLRVSLDELKERARRAPDALDPMPTFSAPGLSVIAEVKRASPSKGALAEISDPAALATAYADGGAAAVSVLTEGRRFHGSLDDFRAVRAQVGVPLLQKDFVTTAYQLWEGRAAGADLCLLIVAALDQEALVSLIERAHSIGLTPLVEVHDPDEGRRALDAGATLIGVNNRDLTTLRVDLDTFARVGPGIREAGDAAGQQVVLVAESGIRGAHDALEFHRLGADVVLVGESLVTGQDPRTAVADLVSAGTHPACLRRSGTP